MSLITTDQFQIPFIVTSAGYKVNRPNMDGYFKKTQLPWIGELNADYQVSDADLVKLENAMIKDTWAHRHTSFWKDNSAQSFAYLTVAVMLGEGINVKVEGKDEASKIIMSWNDEINVRHDTIDDYISTSWLDNLIDGKSLWRVFVDEKDELHKVDIQRVSMETVNVQVHPTRGWRRFIQRAHVPMKHMTQNEFYRHAVPFTTNQMEYVYTIIPDELNCCVFQSFFKSPPVASVLHLMVYKRWITWFMRKFAEKYWAPFIIGYVGDPKSGMMPASDKEREDSLRLTLAALKRIRDFGVGSFLGHTKIETLDTKTSKSAGVYVEYLEYLNKEIVMGLLGSMSLRESSGREKATSDIVQQGYLRFIRGKRKEYGTSLRKFYAGVLLPANGFEGINPRDIKITWPPLRLETIKDTLQAVEIAAKIGAFRDMREMRTTLTPIWKHVDEDITDEEEKKMKDLFLEINSPSRAVGDAPQARASGTTKKPAK